MATLTCTIAGSTIPNANNSRTLTINDTDLQSVLDWVKGSHLQVIANHFNNGVAAGFNPTNAQLEWGWLQVAIVQMTILSTQQHGTTPPPLISFG